MPLKIVFFYNQLNRGFSEIFYAPGNDPKTYIDASLNRQLLTAAIKFRAVNTQLIAVRATAIDPPRLSFTKILNDGFQLPGGNVQDTFPDVTSTDAVYRMNTDTGKVRRIFLRGLRDIDVVRNGFGFDQPTADLVKAVDTYFARLVIAGMQIRFSNRPPTGGLIWNQVKSVQPSQANPSWTDLVLVQEPSILGELPRSITFSGIPRNDLPGFPRTVFALTKSAQAPWIVTIPYRYRAANASYNPLNLKFTTQVYQFGTINGWDFERFSERKTGRPFFTPPGRAKVGVKRL